MITYILTVMSLHCSVSLPRYSSDATAYDCAPSVVYHEFKDTTEDKARFACDKHMAETVRLMGKYAYKVTTSCKRKGSAE